MKLIIVDPITAYIGKINSNNNSEVRSVLEPLSKLAAKYKVAILCISHLNKSSQNSAMYRTLGSMGFVAAARAAFIVAKDKDDKDRRLMLPVKNNTSPEKSGFAFRVVPAEQTPAVGVIDWEEEPVDMDVNEALAPDEFTSNRKKNDRQMAQEDLREALKEGSKTFDQLFKISTNYGLSEKSTRRLLEKIGAKSRKTDFEGHWVWSLPALQLAIAS